MRTLTHVEYDLLEGCIGNYCDETCSALDGIDFPALQGLIDRGLLYSTPCFICPNDNHYATNGRGKMVMQLFQVMKTAGLLLTG